MGYRTLLIGLLALGTIVCTAQTAGEQSAELKGLLELVGDVGRRSNYETYHALTEQQRGLLIEHFREQKRLAGLPNAPGDPDGGPAGDNPKVWRAKRALLLLRDPETVESTLRAFIDLPPDQVSQATIDSLLVVTDPEVIKRLAPEMEKDEPLGGVRSGSAVPKSSTAALLMLQIVANSPSFEANTRKWARNHRGLNEGNRHKLVRRWWTDNAAFFETGDYKSAKAGEDFIKALLARIEDVRSRPNYDAYHGLTAEERGLLIAYFREQKRVASGLNGSRYRYSRLADRKSEEAQRALFLLGDSEVIDSAVRTFCCGLPMNQLPPDEIRFLLLVSDPKVIERLAPELEKPFKLARVPVYRSPPPQGACGVFDGFDLPKPYYAANYILTILANSPAFESDTRKWAEDNALLPLMSTSQFHGQTMAAIRQWWKENEQFFKTGDYKSVKPG